jgi:hypothetical protein
MAKFAKNIMREYKEIMAVLMTIVVLLGVYVAAMVCICLF